MITVLKESDALQMETKVKFTGDCRTYEMYNADYVEFEMILPEGDLSPIFNRDLDGYEAIMGQPIMFKDIDISDCEFEDMNNETSGKLVVTTTVVSEKELSDEDLWALADNSLADLADNIKVHVTGVDTCIEEYVDYSRDDYRGERSIRVDIDTEDSISGVVDNIKVERL